MKKQYLEAGEFVTTHGIGGELRLYPWCDSVDFLTGFDRFFLSERGEGVLKLMSVRPHKNVCVVKVDGVDSVEEARCLIGKTIYIAREDAGLEDGRYFVQDILGARVEHADTSHCYGYIEEVTHPGRHDVWRVKDGESEYWFPAVEPFLVELDIEKEVAFVRPIEGMFEAEVPKKKKPHKKAGKRTDHDTN